MNHKEHYLLTGSTGFLGRSISNQLTALGFKVTGLGRVSQSLNIDIRNVFSFDKDFDPDVVVHAAGKAHSVPRTQEETKDFFDINFEGTKNLCTALEGLIVKPKAFIFISTVAVYGLDSGYKISEDHPLQGETAYSKSKILAEKWLTDWGEKNGIILGILRLPLVAGPNPPGNLGTMIKGIYSGRYFSIGKADAQKSIVWQDDIGCIIPVLSKIGGIYNLTDGIHPSFKQLELVISNRLGKKNPKTIPFSIAKILAFAGDFLGSRFPINSDKLKKITSTLTFDDSKASNLLGWNPSLVLDKLGKSL